MIDNLRALAIFVAVADAGGFSSAARQLKLSKSVVSHHITSLEQRLAVSLFFRSSRKMSLTPEGRQILPSARDMVDAGKRALDIALQQSDQPSGVLRVTAPAFGDTTHLRRALWAFAERYPLISISLNSTDVQVDIIEEGFDMAIRVGALKDSSLKARRITDFRRILVASPKYLAKREKIKSPKDLFNCDFVAISQLQDKLTLSRGGVEETIEPGKIRIEVDTIAAAKSALLDGLGVQRLPLREVEAELASGKLTQVLRDWQLPVLGVFAVWPDTGPQKTLTRLLIDFLVSREVADRNLVGVSDFANPP